jgi:hypothetical protein
MFLGFLWHQALAYLSADAIANRYKKNPGKLLGMN